MVAGVVRFGGDGKFITANRNSYREGYMMSVLNRINRFIRDENGATLLEYTVLIGLMLIAVIVAISAVGTWVGNKWTDLNTALNS